jgi:hypothetical protein
MSMAAPSCFKALKVNIPVNKKGAGYAMIGALTFNFDI